MDYRIPKFLAFNLFVCVLVVIISLQLSQSCNEAVCGSIVSKCMITQACNCGLKNCTCCKDCFSCLSTLYSECCSCVDLCPKPNYTQKSDLSRISHVEELPEPVPELFKLLTAEPDTEQRWITFTFPVDHAISHFHPQLEKEIKYRTKTAEQEVYPEKDMITLNCSVAYMSQCLSWNKCKGSCRSMGAANYRWFHDGCCECVGDKCINYGINESRCLQCPPVKDKLLVETEVDYGEEEEDMQMEKE